MKGITSLGHIALKVRDVEASLAFYRDKLEFPEMLRLTREDGSLWLIYLRVTDEQYLEIFPGADSERAPGTSANGVNHFCLTVANVEDVVRAVTAKGIALYAPIKLGADGNRQAWLQDPDGNRIELMEMAADCLQHDAVKRLRAAARQPATAK